MDPRRSPRRIGNAPLADKLAYLRRYSWSAPTAPRLPSPVRSEPGAVPFHHGLRLHDRQGAQQLRSQTIQAGEYQTVQHPERRPFRRLPPQHVKRMTQNRVFSIKRGPRPEGFDQPQPNQATNLSHKAGASPDSISVASKIEFPPGTGIYLWSRMRRSRAPSNWPGPFFAGPGRAAPPICLDLIYDRHNRRQQGVCVPCTGDTSIFMLLTNDPTLSSCPSLVRASTQPCFEQTHSVPIRACVLNLRHSRG
jgi:hypothetical protein